MPVLGIDASRAIKKEKTGVEWYSYFLLQAMQKVMPTGWKVRCYVSQNPSTSAGHNILVPERSAAESKAWQWKELKWIGRGWTQGRLSLEMMKSPPDVLFVPSHVIPLIHPERTVTTVHDVVFLKHPELYAPDDLENQKRGLDFALKFAKRIIVPSRATGDEVVAAGGRPEQIAVVPHGVEIEHNPSLPPLTLRGGELGRYILFIGRIEKKKNVLGFIHAFRRLLNRHPERSEGSLAHASNVDADKLRDSSPLAQNDSQLKLVLAGPLGYGGEDVLQAIKTFKLTERVLHLGYVDRAHYQALLRSATLLALPSFGEGFGMPILEAMAAGTPVVCSDIPVLREVGGNAAQYVNPRDPEDIARGIAAVLKNEMLQSEMISRGKERVQGFTWEKAARETWRTIEAL